MASLMIDLKKLTMLFLQYCVLYEVFGVTYCIFLLCIFEGSRGSSGEPGDGGN